MNYNSLKSITIHSLKKSSKSLLSIPINQKFLPFLKKFVTWQRSKSYKYFGENEKLVVKEHILIMQYYNYCLNRLEYPFEVEWKNWKEGGKYTKKINITNNSYKLAKICYESVSAV